MASSAGSGSARQCAPTSRTSTSGRVLLVRSGKRTNDRVVPVPGRAAGALDTYITEARPELVKHVDGALLPTRHAGTGASRRRLYTRVAIQDLRQVLARAQPRR